MENQNEDKNIDSKDIAKFKRQPLIIRFTKQDAEGKKTFDLTGALNEVDKRLSLCEEALGYIATWLEEQDAKQGKSIITLPEKNVTDV